MRLSRIFLIVLIVLVGVVSLRFAAIWIGSERMLKPAFYEYPSGIARGTLVAAVRYR